MRKPQVYINYSHDDHNGSRMNLQNRREFESHSMHSCKIGKYEVFYEWQSSGYTCKQMAGAVESNIDCTNKHYIWWYMEIWDIYENAKISKKVCVIYNGLIYDTYPGLTKVYTYRTQNIHIGCQHKAMVVKGSVNWKISSCSLSLHKGKSFYLCRQAPFILSKWEALSSMDSFQLNSNWHRRIVIMIWCYWRGFWCLGTQAATSKHQPYMKHKKQQLSRINHTWNTKSNTYQVSTIHLTQKAITSKSQPYMEHKKQQISRVNHTWNTKSNKYQESTIHGTHKATTIKHQPCMENIKQQLSRINYAWNTQTPNYHVANIHRPQKATTIMLQTNMDCKKALKSVCNRK